MDSSRKKLITIGPISVRGTLVVDASEIATYNGVVVRDFEQKVTKWLASTLADRWPDLVWETTDTTIEPGTMLYVYSMPESMSAGLCFEGAVPITFNNVDWFSVSSGVLMPEIVAAVKAKRYYDKTKRFLILSDRPDIAVTIMPDPT